MSHSIIFLYSDKITPLILMALLENSKLIIAPINNNDKGIVIHPTRCCHFQQTMYM